MLPAAKMRITEKLLTEKFQNLGQPLTDDADLLTSYVNGELIDWRLSDLVREAVKAVTLELYSIGDLVV